MKMKNVADKIFNAMEETMRASGPEKFKRRLFGGILYFYLVRHYEDAQR